MSHELETINGVTRMVYVQETVGTPWHGLGLPVPPGMSVEEFGTKAGLNVEIQKRRLYVRKSPLVLGIMEIPKQYAVMRADDHQFYGVVSDRYQIVQNMEVLNFFKEYVEAGGMEMATAGSLKNGGTIWAMARLGKSFTLAGGDKVEGNMLLANSHDGTMSYQGMFTSVDVVCWNTLSLALNSKLQVQKNGEAKMFKMKHSKKMTKEVMEDAKVKMGLASEKFSRLKEWADWMSHSPVKDPNHVLSFIAQLVSPDLLEGGEDEEIIITAGGEAISKKNQKVVKEEDLNRAGKGILSCILDSPGQELKARKSTWWGVVNGVTRYVDHEAGRGRDTALTSAWFGTGNLLKQQASELAMEYAKR